MSFHATGTHDLISDVRPSQTHDQVQIRSLRHWQEDALRVTSDAISLSSCHALCRIEVVQFCILHL